MKSRVNRARNKLAEIMGIDSAAEIGAGTPTNVRVAG
jgi:hypothetical protein